MRGVFELILVGLLLLVLIASNPSKADFISSYPLPRGSLLEGRNTSSNSRNGHSIVVQPLRPDREEDAAETASDVINDAANQLEDIANDVVDSVAGADADSLRVMLASVLEGEAVLERRNFVVASIFTVPRAGKDILVLGIADTYFTLSQ
jgi:hypothetical protein